MGYACPVCGDPQADAGHLANHLAFTAILGEDAHEAWLDEHAPGWGRMNEAALADHVVDRVEETEFPQVFEDTVGGLDPPNDALEERSGALFEDADQDHDHDRDHGHGHGLGHDHDHGNDHTATDSRVAPGGGRSIGSVDEATAAIIEDARKMTRRMYADADGEGSDAGDDVRFDADETVDDDDGTDDTAVDGAENE